MKKILKLYGAIIFSGALFIESCASKHQLINPVVRTENGYVKGLRNKSQTVTVFKGVPYAAPPVGQFRWREPQPLQQWKGVLNADTFKASAFQIKQGSRLPWTKEFMVQNTISEDCLYLNIWTPAIKRNQKLAVLVFIHGGALIEGSGAIDVYNGEELSKQGIVVVTINYRLGVFGFLAHPELSAESPNHVSGNYGLLDQIAALKWVRANISAFGGNPQRVTIGGQSAGAGSVNALIISPQAAGLFQGAITESGTRYRSDRQFMPMLAVAEKEGVKFAKAKGVNSIEMLREMSAEKLIAADNIQPSIHFGRVIDGYYQPDDIEKVVAEGKQNDTPLLNGFNADETTYTGEKGPTFDSLYYPTGRDRVNTAEKLAGQEQYRVNAHLWMELRGKTAKTNGYEYFFTRAIPWPEHPEFGAFHTSEIPYVFNNLKTLNRPWSSIDSLVAKRMSSYWVNFVKSGNPNGKGLPNWSAFQPANEEVMEIGEHTGMIPIAGSIGRIIFLKKQLLKVK